MTARFLFMGLVFLSLVAFGCKKDEMLPADCGKLQEAILAGNPDDVETEINRICSSLINAPDSHEGLKALTDKISSECKVSADTLCYDCIKTLPAQSEIRISVIAVDLQKDKIIDIIRSGDKFVFAGMHD